MSDPKPPFVRRVRLRNYKSIRACDVTLGPLTFLVGPNGSGKSNFLDALRFVADSLRVTLQEALNDRRGIYDVASRWCEAGDSLAIELWVTLANGEEGYFGFEIGTNRECKFEVCAEECRIRRFGQIQASYIVKNGVVESATMSPCPPASTDRFYLTIASSFPEFRGIYDGLVGMAFYNVNPVQMRDELFVRGADVLGAQGEGVGTIFRELGQRNPAVKGRLEDYMCAILPCVRTIEVESFIEYMGRIDPDSVAYFKRSSAPWKDEPSRFYFVLQAADRLEYMDASQMSDGTLRALGVLLGLFQCAARRRRSPFPWSASKSPRQRCIPRRRACCSMPSSEASHFTQVMVTTHSPELLNSKEVDPQSILVVEAPAGETIIGRPDEASLSVIRDRLYTPGELLEMNQLHPDAGPPQAAAQATHITS